MRAGTSILCSLALLVALFASAASANAQQGACFAETGHCIGGRFAQYWQQNGGLAVFGYPLTDETTEQSRTVQYFERQRFELHTENAAPYDVLLGLLGEEILQQQGIDWHTQPTAPGPAAGCLWFEQTRHNVCDQAPTSGFKQYWQTHGLEFDGRAGKSYQESLALFGLPVSEPFQQTINGEMLEVQWFERARFEWHSGNADPYRVLLGRLAPKYTRLLCSCHPHYRTQARTTRLRYWHRSTTQLTATSMGARMAIGRVHPARTTSLCRATPTPPASS